MAFPPTLPARPQHNGLADALKRTQDVQMTDARPEAIEFSATATAFRNCATSIPMYASFGAVMIHRPVRSFAPEFFTSIAVPHPPPLSECPGVGALHHLVLA
jgi:hypothetical protein